MNTIKRNRMKLIGGLTGHVSGTNQLITITKSGVIRMAKQKNIVKKKSTR